LLEAVTSRLLVKTLRARKDLGSVEISDGAEIKCNYELYAKVVNASNIQSKTPSMVTPYHVTIRLVVLGNFFS
jgi:predicted N-formylglutamate amidohydrolase